MKKFYYYSEMGCIKIGNESFNSLLLNGKGEGSFWINLCDKKEKVDKKGYEFISQISGNDINVYENDVGDNKIFKLKEGIYSIFNKKGEILIECQNY